MEFQFKILQECVQFSFLKRKGGNIAPSHIDLLIISVTQPWNLLNAIETLKGVLTIFGQVFMCGIAAKPIS